MTSVPLAAQAVGNPVLPAGLLELGNTYWLGAPGTPRDRVRAAECYRMAAEAGDAEAMARLGRMYFRGEGIPKDAALAMKWLT